MVILRTNNHTGCARAGFISIWEARTAVCSYRIGLSADSATRVAICLYKDHADIAPMNLLHKRICCDPDKQDD